MVVVDYSARDRFRNDSNQEDNQRHQIHEDSGLDLAIINFCPKLRQSLSLLSQHKVGKYIVGSTILIKIGKTLKHYILIYY